MTTGKSLTIIQMNDSHAYFDLHQELFWIGIASPIVDKTVPPSFSKGLCFTLGNNELPGFIAKLRNEEKVDLTVVLSHLGFPQDVKPAREVRGIDVLLSSHTHNRLYAPRQI